MNQNIEILNQWGGRWLEFAWPMLWQSSVLILVVGVLDYLLARRIRASVRHALWLVVLVKLLLPPTLALPTGVAWWLTPTKTAVKVTEHFTVNYSDAVMPMDFTTPAVRMPQPPVRLSTAGWALAGSLAVSVGLLGWLVIRWVQVVWMVRRATEAGELDSALAEARRMTGLRARVRLKLVEERLSPAVCGLFRPVILLPRQLVERLSAGQLRAVLLHELIHLRRADIWVNCGQALLQILYWWHPLVWLANGRMRRVREEAVDDAVMVALNAEAELYAPTLLEVAKLALHRPRLSLGLVGIMESRSALRHRIERLVDFRAPRQAGLTVASVLGILAFGAVTLPMGGAPGPVEEQADRATVGAVGMAIGQDGSTNAQQAQAVMQTPLRKVQEAYDEGRLDEAKARVKWFLALDPTNSTALYYSNLVEEARQEAARPASDHGQPVTRTYKVETRVFLKNLRGQGGLAVTNAHDVAVAVGNFFHAAGVDMQPTNKAVIYNERNGLLLVRAPLKDQKIVESVIRRLNYISSEVQLRASFLQLPERITGDAQKAALITNGTATVLDEGQTASLLAFLKTVHGCETLASPQVTGFSGQQCQVRVTKVITVVSNAVFTVTAATDKVDRVNGAVSFPTGQIEFGPELDVTPTIVPGGRIKVAATASDLQFFGYAAPHQNFFGYTDSPIRYATDPEGDKIPLPEVLLATRPNRATSEATLINGQTMILFPKASPEPNQQIARHIAQAEKKYGKKRLLVLVTATIVDQAGNRVKEDYYDAPFPKSQVDQ